MNRRRSRLFFDYVDPLSYLVEVELRAVEESLGWVVERVPFELSVPPAAMVDPASPEWAERMQDAGPVASELGLELREPPFVPWTRKAHELVMHARTKGVETAVHRAVFAGVFEEGLDIGRIDVLVRLAQSCGLDPTEAKAVLDVDKHTEEIEQARRSALDSGIEGAPTLVAGARRCQGFHNRSAIRTFLHVPDDPAPTTD